MNVLKIVLVVILFIGLMIGLSFLFGWVDVLQTRTVGKAKQDAQREVFEQTQSYVEGKRQEALKLYNEYLKSDADDKERIRNIVQLSFANFDEDKYLTGELKKFVYSCKYNH